MYYYADKKEFVEKYLITFSKDELENLRIDVINNCSEIVHHEYDATHGPNKYDGLKIRNYSEKFIKIKESNDSLQWPDQKIYHYSYDEYKFPNLVSIIDELIKGNTFVLDELLNDSIISKVETIEERIKKASDELDNIDNLKIHEKKEKLNELQHLINLNELNKNQKSIIPYYDKLNKLLVLELVDTISKEELERVYQFFETKLNIENKQKNMVIIKKS